VIGSEVHSAGLDMTSRTGSLSFFGDELEQAVLSREEDLTKGILLRIYTQKATCRRINRKGPRNGRQGVTDILLITILMMKVIFHMNGQFVFKNAVVRFAEVINEGLK
jgi:3-oxoacyl-[acyl-carrier-protein] synthase-3